MLLAAAAMASYLHQPLWLLVPVALVFVLYGLQFPLMLFYILLATIPWSIEYNITPSIGTDLPDEPLMLLLSFAVVAYIFYHRRTIAPVIKHPLALIVLLHFTWIIVTVIFSSHQALSLKYLLAKSWYLMAFVGAPLLLIKDEKPIRTSAIVLLTSMLLFTFLTMVRHEQYNWTFDKINTALEPFYRNHVNYSALLVFMVPVQLAVIRLTDSKGLRTFLWMVLIVSLFALYFSYARGAWLSLITGYAGYWLLKKRLIFFGFILAMLFTVAAVFYLKTNDRYLAYSHDYKSTVFHTNFKEHLVATYKMNDVSTAERYYRWIAGIRMTKDSWKTGLGPNTFYHHYKSYTVPAFKTWVSVNEEQSTVHNYFLYLLIEQGLAGLLIFIALVGAMFWHLQAIYNRTVSRFWKIASATMAAMLVMICTINFLSDLIESDKVGSLFFILISIIIIGDRQTKKASDLSPYIQGIS
jgi:O-antigen ligase